MELPPATKSDTAPGAAADLAPHPPANRADAPGQAPSTAQAPGPARGWGLPLAVLITGMFMSILDISIVNVAISSIRRDFGVSAENVQWISTAYSLTEGVVVPVSAWLGARFGLHRVYIWALVLFTAASALCAVAGSLDSLIFARVLQAIPGGVLPVLCQVILYRIVPREKLGTAMGLFGLGVAVAPATGPALGGYLVEHFSWRAIFYINLPIGLLGAVAAAVVLAKFPVERNRSFDVPGFVCIAGALFSLLLAIEEGSSWGWTSYPVLILFAVAANLLALFVVVELHVDQPMLDLRVLRHWPFVNSLLLISAMMLGLYAVMFYIPLFLQSVQRLNAWDAGVLLLPQAVVMAVLMPIAGQLYDRFGARWLSIIGLSLSGAGILMLSRIDVNIPRAQLVLGMVVMATGLGLSMMPIMTGGLASLPTELTDSGSAVNTLVQRVSAAFGLAVLTALVTADRAQFWADRSALLAGDGADVDPRIIDMQQQGQTALIPLWQQLSNQVQTQAYSNAFFVAGCVALLGAALAFLLRSGRPDPGADKPAVH